MFYFSYGISDFLCLPRLFWYTVLFLKEACLSVISYHNFPEIDRVKPKGNCCKCTYTENYVCAAAATNDFQSEIPLHRKV